LNPNTDEAETHVYIIDEVDNLWRVVGDFKNKNNEIDRVEFGDVNGDGLTDVLVGWSTYSINQNELYCYIFGDNIEEINTKKTYTDMAVGDFTNESKSTIITLTLSSTDSPAVSRLLTVGDNNVVGSYECQLDSDITKFTQVTSGYIDSTHLGVFADGLNSSNIYNTQVIYFDTEAKALMNPVYSSGNNGVLSTARDVNLKCQDSDNDGIIEVPITTHLPYPKKQSGKNYAYQTCWSNFKLEDSSFLTKSTVIINSNYNYSVKIPQEWINGYTASYNGDSSVLTITKATMLKNSTQYCVEGEIIVTYIATLAENWTSLGAKQGYTKMSDLGAYSYGYKIYDNPPYDFTKENAVEIFLAKDEEESIAVAPTEASTK
jgi:hypothetical protein